MLFERLVRTLFVIACFVIFSSEAYALMTSSNYRLYADQAGGSGARSTSSNYILQDTAGDETAMTGSSTNYTLLAGFQELSEHPVFTFTPSVGTLSLTLSKTSVAEESFTLTSSTNAPFGFTTSVNEQGELTNGSYTVTDVSDGSVTAGESEYGISVTGTDASFGDDRSISGSARTLGSRGNWVNGSELTVTYKVALPSAASAGTYTQTLHYVSTANF